MLLPIHFEGAYTGEFDPGEYISEMNQACQARGILGRAMFLERGVWYQFSIGAAKL